MSDTGGSRRKEPVVRPSKFGAGYTVGGPPAPQVPPAPVPVLPTPVVSEMPSIAVSDSGKTGAHSAEQVAERPAAVAIAERPAVVSAPAAGRNVLATAALVLVVLFGAFSSPITLVMAHVARARIKKTGERGAGVALAALVLSYVFMFVGMVVLAVDLAIT